MYMVVLKDILETYSTQTLNMISLTSLISRKLKKQSRKTQESCGLNLQLTQLLNALTFKKLLKCAKDTEFSFALITLSKLQFFKTHLLLELTVLCIPLLNTLAVTQMSLLELLCSMIQIFSTNFTSTLNQWEQ